MDTKVKQSAQRDILCELCVFICAPSGFVFKFAHAPLHQFHQLRQ